MKHPASAALAVSVIFGLLATGCVDLNVANPNDPTRDQVLSTAGDVESLVSGALRTWYTGVHNHNSLGRVGNLSFESSTTSCKYGNATIPRIPFRNDVGNQDYEDEVAWTWVTTYRALTAVADGLHALDAQPQIESGLARNSENGEIRLRAFARMVQAVGHATIAVFYDQGYLRDEDTDLTREPEAVPYSEMMGVAYEYFDQAIALAGSADFTIPAEWMSVEVTSDELVRLLHSWRAVFRASLPRWDTESVNWTAVLADLDAGLAGTFAMEADGHAGWYNGAFDVTSGPYGWGHESYFVLGMADQAGNYQRWLAMPIEDRVPWFDDPSPWQESDDPFLIVTPDTRFPRGAALADQIAAPGEQFVIPTMDVWGYSVQEHFGHSARGTWRWSYYWSPVGYDYWFQTDPTIPLISAAELDLLRAEALFETGDAAGAAALVNSYRTAHGLAATDPSGANADCVPRLPNGMCGGLFEMLKWEKRLEVESVGLFNNGWYWDSRRWGDLYRGTPLQWPIPAGDAIVVGIDPYTFGGPSDTPPGASDGSGYGWPSEGPSASMAASLGGC